MNLNIDRKSFRSIIFISAICTLVIVVTIVGLINITGRFSRLSKAEEYVNGAGGLEQDYQTLVIKFFELKKLNKGLELDSLESSYNDRIKYIVDKIKMLNLEMTTIEYGSEMLSSDIKYLPVTFELSGNFNTIIDFIVSIENEIQVMGFARLEITTKKASDTKLNLNCIINLYELNT
jgi:Tfp pilus assembly protein PilO